MALCFIIQPLPFIQLSLQAQPIRTSSPPPPPPQPQALLPGNGVKGGVEAADHLLDGFRGVENMVSLPWHQTYAWKGGGRDGDEVQKVRLRPRRLIPQILPDPSLPLALLLSLPGLLDFGFLLQAVLFLQIKSSTFSSCVRRLCMQPLLALQWWNELMHSSIT
jgi:hypothetical protein